MYTDAKLVKRVASLGAGPIGGGMCNVIFSPPETKVFSIDSPTFFDVNFRFGYSMEHTDLTHFEYTEFTDKDRQAIFDDEIRIQAQKIREKKQNQQ